LLKDESESELKVFDIDSTTPQNWHLSRKYCPVQ